MEQIKFYFDNLKYAEKMRHVRLSIMFAKEIVQAVAKSEINADIDIIRGLYDVHYEKQETVQNNVQVVGALNNSNTPKMYNNVLVTNERGERAFNAYLEEQLSRYPKPLQKRYKSDIIGIIENLKMECYGIRQKWERNESFINTVPSYAIEIDDKDVKVSLDFTNELRNTCNVYAKDDRAVKVYKALEKAVKALNSIVSDVSTPSQILDCIKQHPLDGEFTLAEYDYNIL